MYTVLVPNSQSVLFFFAVGGGTAGCVLAARLSENNDVTVLLLEAGGSDWGNPNIDIPGELPKNLKSDIDWNYVAERQEGLLQDLREEVGQSALQYPLPSWGASLQFIKTRSWINSIKPTTGGADPGPQRRDRSLQIDKFCLFFQPCRRFTTIHINEKLDKTNKTHKRMIYEKSYLITVREVAHG